MTQFTFLAGSRRSAPDGNSSAPKPLARRSGRIASVVARQVPFTVTVHTSPGGWPVAVIGHDAVGVPRRRRQVDVAGSSWSGETLVGRRSFRMRLSERTHSWLDPAVRMESSRLCTRPPAIRREVELQAVRSILGGKRRLSCRRGKVYISGSTRSRFSTVDPAQG